MIPILVDVGAVGSPVDVATLLIVLAELVYRLRPRQETMAAGLVALAEGRDDVDDERLQDDLNVDDREVDALRPQIVYQEGEES
jgi:hypothetical protein